jgi:hypothetical protein
MVYQELTNIIDKIGSTKKELEELLNYSKNYFTSFTKKTIPKHIVITIKLIEALHDNKIDYRTELKKMNLDKNPHKGGKFEKK